MIFSIEHHCPQCGAPAVLDESERLFACEYCRVKSFLLGDGFFRYWFPHSLGGDKVALFFPYWRFKGMVFSCKPQGIEHRFVDISHQAFHSPHFPISVGLRSQALKLRFAVPGTAGNFIVPQLSFEQVMKTMEEQIKPGNAEIILHRAFIGDSLTMIYSPYYLEDKLFDGVLREARTLAGESIADIIRYPTEAARWALRFIPAICPDCGRDLEGRNQALALICTNCPAVWQAGPKGLMKLDFGRMGELDNNAYYLPFWRIKARISGLELQTVADLVQAANLPKVVQPKMRDMPFYFWVQAFKIRPQRFLQLATGLTLAQPQGELQCEIPDARRCHPVTLQVIEARESLKILLANFLKPSGVFLPRLPEIGIASERFSLVFLPFTDNLHELVQPEYHLSVNKNMLALANAL